MISLENMTEVLRSETVEDKYQKPKSENKANSFHHNTPREEGQGRNKKE